jgi:hypothetical protein
MTIHLTIFSRFVATATPHAPWRNRASNVMHDFIRLD